MKTLCPNCYSNQVIPATVASPSFPQSLDPTLLSPTVLASLGVAICKHLAIPPIYGIVIGTIAGIALSSCSSSQSACTSYYCRNCNQLFDSVDNRCPNYVVQSN